MHPINKGLSIKAKLAWLLIIIILLIFSFKWTQNQLPTSSYKFVKPTPSPTGGLANVISSSLQGTNGTYAIIVKNLKNNQGYSLNEHQIFESGSLYKLWVMAVVYQEIQNGVLTKDQELTEDIPTLNQKFNIDPDLAEQTEGTVSFSVNDALHQMITISHNYAALLLTEQIKLSAINTFLKYNDFTDSKVGINDEEPTTSAFDTASFFEKLYKGQLANPQYTEEMISLLKGQQLNNKIPQYLPANIPIAHKTGEIDNFTHDGGIVFGPKGDYIIVILSQSNYPPGAVDRISQISKAVYDYFSN